MLHSRRMYCASLCIATIVTGTAFADPPVSKGHAGSGNWAGAKINALVQYTDTSNGDQVEFLMQFDEPNFRHVFTAIARFNGAGKMIGERLVAGGNGKQSFQAKLVSSAGGVLTYKGTLSGHGVSPNSPFELSINKNVEVGEEIEIIKK